MPIDREGLHRVEGKLELLSLPSKRQLLVLSFGIRNCIFSNLLRWVRFLRSTLYILKVNNLFFEVGRCSHSSQILQKDIDSGRCPFHNICCPFSLPDVSWYEQFPIYPSKDILDIYKYTVFVCVYVYKCTYTYTHSFLSFF